MKQKFITKWSSWWCTRNNGKELTEAFERELNAIIKQEVASKNLVKADIIKSVCEHKNKRIRNFVFWCDDCKKYV